MLENYWKLEYPFPHSLVVAQTAAEDLPLPPLDEKRFRWGVNFNVNALKEQIQTGLSRSSRSRRGQQDSNLSEMTPFLAYDCVQQIRCFFEGWKTPSFVWQKSKRRQRCQKQRTWLIALLPWLNPEAYQPEAKEALGLQPKISYRSNAICIHLYQFFDL